MKRIDGSFARVAIGTSLIIVLVFGLRQARAAETVSLSAPDAENLGWAFDNGREFPGAKGGLSVTQEGGKPTFVLKGDFTGGGNYVQMARAIDDLDIDTITLDYKSDGSDVLTFRIIDAAKQCHQIRYRIEGGTDWQTVRFPLRRFFENKGKPGAVPGIIQYEKWGGPNDGQWHGPAKLLVILAGRTDQLQQREIAVRDVRAVVASDGKPAESDAGARDAPAAVVHDWVHLLDAEDKGEWVLGLGQEFPGAKGELKTLDDQPKKDQVTLQLTADFSGGGGYVETRRSMKWAGVQDMDRLRLRVRSQTIDRLSLRLGDGSGQTHQRKGFIKFPADGQWHDVELAIADIVGGESWGGAKDKQWHAPPQYLSLIISKNLIPESDRQTPHVVEFADISVRAVTIAAKHGPSYAENFEASSSLPSGWEAEGDVAIATGQAFEGQRALRLARTQNQVDHPTRVMSSPFAVTPGHWLISGSFKSELVSPDNSFKGVLVAQMLDASGKMVSQTTVVELWGGGNWQPVRKQVMVPTGAVSARLVARLEKTHGVFLIDDLSASYVESTTAQEDRVLRVLFQHERIGHLLYPGDAADMTLTVETGPKLPEEAQQVRYVVTDYWGAEQIEPRTAKLTYRNRANDGRRVYETTLDLSEVNFETGRYYEVHASIPEPGGRTHDEFTSLAYLPAAVTKQYTWEQVPFTSRNWDNRIPEYFHLTDRLGIRMAGVWGGWGAEPPYKQSAPGYDLAMELGIAVLMRGPSHAIESHAKGYEKYTPEVLREGARKQAESYGPEDRMAITMGNEPPDVEGRAAEAVAAYQALYEGYTSANPNLFLVGTSVGTTESYFAAGMGKYLDAYDFHTYNDVTGIRKIFQRYEEMFEKYGHRKPIWSTELGLNSQGMERRAVAGDLIRKFTTFFACGGNNASWFGLLYPDVKGTITGSASDSHNVFNCKYKRYSPRLDAIAYYNMVNGICIKKFVEERAYGEIMATLFRDAEGRCLQVLWNDRSASEVFVPLDGVGEVKRIVVDGSITELDADGRGLTLRIGEDPVLLLYDQAEGGLPDALGQPLASIAAMPDGLVKGEAADIVVALSPDVSPDEIELVAPPFWPVSNKRTLFDEQGRLLVTFTVTAPQQTGARAGLLHLTITHRGKIVGQLDFSQQVRGATTARLLPAPLRDGKAGVRLELVNNSADAQQIDWEITLGEAFRMTDGLLAFNKAQSPDAYFAAPALGQTTVLGQATEVIEVPLNHIDPLTSYTVHATVTDAQGRTLKQERMMGGFIAAPHTAAPITLDGKPDEPAWGACEPIAIDQADQYFMLKQLDPQPWDGVEDISARVRLLWDDQYLYMAFDIKDDVLAQGQRDGMLWQQDGIQLLIDPSRASDVKSGKYDYSMGVGTKGPQVWCHLSASPAVPNGEATDIRYVQAASEGSFGGKSVGDSGGSSGGRTVEIAIPWSRLAPFVPASGENLGMCIVINEDDKPIRNCYMNWFGDINSKSVKANGDIILTK